VKEWLTSALNDQSYPKNKTGYPFFDHHVDLESAEELYQKRITRILTTDFPHYFAVVTRVRQESSTVGNEGGMIASTVIPQVQAVFPEGALTKNIKVGLQVRHIILFIVIRQQW